MPSRRLNRVLLSLRRVHLYTGLFLIPWGLVYGASALLFNHPTWFAAASQRSLEADSESWPNADLVAETLVAAISSEQGLVLEARSGAFWTPGLLTGEHEAAKARLIVTPNEDAMELTLRPRPPARKSDLSPRLQVPGLQRELQRKAERVAEAAARQGVALSQVRFARGPTLRFEARDSSSQRWDLRYDLGRQRLRATPLSRELGWRDLLLRLHVSHGYAAHSKVRMAWALFTDLMALSLLFWCLSGFLMWLQMTKLRRVGVICLLGSLAAALPLFLAMHASLR